MGRSIQYAIAIGLTVRVHCSWSWFDLRLGVVTGQSTYPWNDGRVRWYVLIQAVPEMDEWQGKEGLMFREEELEVLG